jgi:hypothetical protein
MLRRQMQIRMERELKARRPFFPRNMEREVWWSSDLLKAAFSGVFVFCSHLVAYARVMGSCIQGRLICLRLAWCFCVTRLKQLGAGLAML